MPSYERPQSGAVTAVGVLSIIYGALYVVLGVVLVFAGAWILSVLGVVKASATGTAEEKAAIEAAGGLEKFILGAIYLCAGGSILYGIFPIVGGISVLKRTGKTMTFVFAILALIWGVLSLIVLDIIGIVIQFGFGITSLIILSKFSYEFDKGPRARPGD